MILSPQTRGTGSERQQVAHRHSLNTRNPSSNMKQSYSKVYALKYVQTVQREKGNEHLNLCFSLFTTTKTWKQPKCPLTRGMDTDVVHIYDAILLSCKKRMKSRHLWQHGEPRGYWKWKVKVLVVQSCSTLCNPMDCACKAPLSMGFLRQEYWSGLLLPSPRDLPDPRIKPMFLMSAALAGGFFLTASPGNFVS